MIRAGVLLTMAIGIGLIVYSLNLPYYLNNSKAKLESDAFDQMMSNGHDLNKIDEIKGKYYQQVEKIKTKKTYLILVLRAGQINRGNSQLAIDTNTNPLPYFNWLIFLNLYNNFIQMKTLTVYIEDELSGKAIIAVLDALKLGYEIDDDGEFKDETERIMANSYLSEKITQGRKDMEEGKGTRIALEETWK